MKLWLMKGSWINISKVISESLVMVIETGTSSPPEMTQTKDPCKIGVVNRDPYNGIL